MSLVSRLKEKDQVIDLVRSEARINAQALKKFVEENQTLRGEYNDLVNQCKDLRRKCLIYHLDLEASMRSRNEAEERARDAESTIQELDQELRHVSNVINKQECLVDSVLATIVSGDETKFGRMLLEENIQDQSCLPLLRKWNQLKPSMHKAISLVFMLINIEKEKECLIVKLERAEQELELAREQNREVHKESRNLLRQ
ncbi:unnamed protein product [Eruca vesicaria subsp. sativa]|uniref:Uncharacterized protein n=1 Tax=Eruca vesicaria subsp. sativa TaxID=29727 RepID=A0ABC8LFI9_ERUVS|nr:unnamed protein product [Eruca vesicaria subsp. sativa]